MDAHAGGRVGGWADVRAQMILCQHAALPGGSAEAAALRSSPRPQHLGSGRRDVRCRSHRAAAGAPRATPSCSTAALARVLPGASKSARMRHNLCRARLGAAQRQLPLAASPPLPRPRAAPACARAKNADESRAAPLRPSDPYATGRLAEQERVSPGSLSSPRRLCLVLCRGSQRLRIRGSRVSGSQECLRHSGNRGFLEKPGTGLLGRSGAFDRLGRGVAGPCRVPSAGRGFPGRRPRRPGLRETGRRVKCSELEWQQTRGSSFRIHRGSVGEYSVTV